MTAGSSVKSLGVAGHHANATPEGDEVGAHGADLVKPDGDPPVVSHHPRIGCVASSGRVGWLEGADRYFVEEAFPGA